MIFCSAFNRRSCVLLGGLVVAMLALGACGDDADDGGEPANSAHPRMDAASRDGGIDTGVDGRSIADGGMDGASTDGSFNDGGADAGMDGSASTDGGRDATPAALEIAGSYETDYGTLTITDETWTSTLNMSEPVVSTIVQYDNADNFAITQNPDDAEYSPGKFNKNVWTEPAADGALYYCTIANGLDTADAAATTDKTADATDPANGGCGNFPWTELRPM